MHSFSRSVFAIFLFSLSTFSIAADTGNHASDNSDLANGAAVYVERCSLCHGNAGLGEGLIPLAIDDYPSTNLLEAQYAHTKEEVRQAVLLGGSEGAMSEFSPRWAEELTEQDVDAVADFVMHLREDKNSALSLIEGVETTLRLSAISGKQVYQARCVLCHGVEGKGDGKMSKIIKEPPPFDLTASVVPPEYITLIVYEGGEALGRSKQMPPWKDTLHAAELESVVLYLQTLRE